MSDYLLLPPVGCGFWDKTFLIHRKGNLYTLRGMVLRIASVAIPHPFTVSA